MRRAGEGGGGGLEGAETEMEYYMGGYYSNHNILGTEHNSPLTYAKGSKLHHLNMIMPGGHGAS